MLKSDCTHFSNRGRSERQLFIHDGLTSKVLGFNLSGDVYICKLLGWSLLLTLCPDTLVAGFEPFILKAGMCNLLSESALGLIKLPEPCMKMKQNKNMFIFTVQKCNR